MKAETITKLYEIQKINLLWYIKDNYKENTDEQIEKFKNNYQYFEEFIRCIILLLSENSIEEISTEAYILFDKMKDNFNQQNDRIKLDILEKILLDKGNS
jgi:hypothetical protein